MRKRISALDLAAVLSPKSLYPPSISHIATANDSLPLGDMAVQTQGQVQSGPLRPPPYPRVHVSTIPPPSRSSDEDWMRHAFALADRAEQEFDEIPVGAVLVGAEGEILGEGWNRNLSESDPSAHAEIVAMRQAGQKLGNHRLIGTTLFVTLEPCAMCAMAMVHARVSRLVFAATDPKTGACGSVFDLIADPRHNHRIAVQGGVLAEEASRRLSNYFRAKRGRPPLP
jgi:tRNA(adenine34) deaminase